MKKVKMRSISGIEYEFSDFRCEFRASLTPDEKYSDIIYYLKGICYVRHDSYAVAVLASFNPQEVLFEYDRLKRQLDELPDDMTIDDETKQLFHNHLLEI